MFSNKVFRKFSYEIEVNLVAEIQLQLFEHDLRWSWVMLDCPCIRADLKWSYNVTEKFFPVILGSFA